MRRALPRSGARLSRPSPGARLLALATALGAISTACRLPRLEEIESQAPPLAQTSIVYAADGTRIATLHAEEDRVVIPIRRIPQVMQDAVVAIEDHRFWTHRGIDLKALLRAAYVNATSGRIVEGGSTITQQYVKNALVGTEKTLRRKIREAALAWQLEHKYSKPTILGKYLNTVYFGQGAYGIQAAARKFFSRPADHLTLPQSALLAGLIAGPERYDPVDRPDAALARRNEVLDRMLELGFITDSERDRAVRARLRLRLAPERRKTVAPWFLNYVKHQILSDERFGETYTQRYNFLFRGGLRIYTTLDPRAERAAERAVRGILSQPGDPYGALTAIDPRTGHIVAMVGGRDYYAPRRVDPYAKLNLATGGSTGRQAGSAFKPFALVAALERGIPPSRTYRGGSEITIPMAWGPPWSVRNYEGSSFGDLSVEEATVASVNVIYAQIIMEVGPEAVAEVARRMGIHSRLRSVPSAVLGTNEVSPLEMASAYGALAAGGFHTQPSAVTRITDADGRVLYEPHPRPRQVLSPAVASVATEILQNVILRGTGRAADIGRPAAGKTGTAQMWRDAWFVGFVPQLVAAVWVGFPQAQVPMVPPTTRIRVTGGSFPAQVWHAFMIQVTRRMAVEDFPVPDDRYVAVAIDVTQGCLANRFTPPEAIRVVRFVAGTEPRETCLEPAAPELREVPVVVGMSAVNALSVLQGQGFTVSRRDEYSREYPPGTVIRQEPEPGARARTGTTVVIVVATDRAPAVVVPNVVGMSREDAVRTLEDAGFAVEVVEAYECDPADPDCAHSPGVVWRQTPAAGTERKHGSTVGISVNPG